MKEIERILAGLSAADRKLILQAAMRAWLDTLEAGNQRGELRDAIERVLARLRH